MALINCKECGYEMSTNADSCPNCGNKEDKFYKDAWFWLYCGSGVFCVNIFGGFPLEFSLLLGISSFLLPAISDLPKKDFFINATSFTRFIFSYLALFVLLSVILYLIFLLSLIFTYFFVDEKFYLYDFIYGYEEILLGLYLFLPLIFTSYGFFFVHVGDDDMDGVQTNPYTPLEDKNLLIKNIIELSGKTSWEDDLEKLDIEALNDIHEKLNRHTNE